eukprot:c17496_g1_i2.p1 GENE.c17496_g1_i2~~c17496_g1_i2.p1  ORF type:complete len:842 (+),score=170.50 c17496_g1_i2:216-2528(+)
MKEKYYYAWILDVIADTQDSTLFMVRFREGREALYLNSSVREELLDEFHICWKTDHMYRRWEVAEFPLKTGRVPLATKLALAEEFNKPWAGYKRHEFGDYFFFLREEFKAGWSPRTRKYTGDYVIEGKPNNEYYKVVQLDLESVVQIGKYEKEHLRIDTERHARTLASKQGGKQALLYTTLIEKRVNLTGDVASYLGWLAHIRTETRDVAVVVVRRRYIPPEGEYYQDVMIQYFGTLNTIAKKSQVLEWTQRIVDSLSPLRPVRFYDDTLAQVKSQGLLFDEESYNWFAGMGFYPSVADGARAFFKSICNILFSENRLDMYDPEHIETNEQLIDDPMDIILDMEGEPPGLNHESPISHQETWKAKVSRYFAYVLDGGLHPDTFDIAMLAKMVIEGNISSKTDETITKLLDYALYMRTRGEPFHRGQTIVEKLNDENMMKDFVVNERVLGILLSTNYMDKTITDLIGKKVYVTFLLTLLKRNNTVNLTIDTVRAVAILSGDVSGRSQLVKAHVIQLLIPYLQVNHEEIILSVGRALVNLSGDNLKAKAEIVLQNGIRYVVQNNHLSDKGPEVVKTMCALIKNCLNAEEAQRKKIAQDGVAQPLIELIKTPTIEGLKVQDEVVAKAASAIWNLCGSEDGKTAVVQAGGNRALIELLKQPASTANDVAFEKAAGALMMLCATNDEQKKVAVTEPDFVATVIDRAIKVDSVTGLRNATGLLAVLSSVEAFKSFRERAGGVVDRVNKLISESKQKSSRTTEKLQQFLEQLQRNLQ